MRLAGLADTTPALDSFTRWMREIAIPFWAERGFDNSTGMFEEALDFDGRPVAAPRRAMVQARQIFVFASAALLGWHDAAGGLAEQAGETLVKTYCVDRGGRTATVFAVDQRGAILDPTLDSYTHAFVLFALAWLYRLNGNHKVLVLADRIRAFVAAELTDAVHGGLIDRVGEMASPKRQNPIMHLLEAYIALEQAAPGRGYLDHASRLVTLFEHRLLRGGFLVEEQGADWGKASVPEQKLRWEPGHHYEWSWLLECLDRMTGFRSSRWSVDLSQTARRYGHASTGLIYDELSDDLSVTGQDHRLWPHAEALKAALFWQPEDEFEPRAFADAMAERLTRYFVGRPFAAGWIDRIDTLGTPLVDRVPASSLYHLMLAATETDRIKRTDKMWRNKG